MYFHQQNADHESERLDKLPTLISLERRGVENWFYVENKAQCMKNINLHCPQVREEPSSRYKDEMFFNLVMTILTSFGGIAPYFLLDVNKS